MPGAFEARAARAELLAPVAPAAEAPLRFAAGLYRAQGALAQALLRAHAEQPLSGDPARDTKRAWESVRMILRHCAEQGPALLGADAAQRLEEDPEAGRARLAAHRSAAKDVQDDYLSRAILRPWAEVAIRAGVALQAAGTARGCPDCGGAPWVASRRSGSNEDGAQRYLHCAGCGGTWTAGRLRCPVCDEADPPKLPVFQSDKHPAVRIEACESCKSYVKSLDLTQDARPIPEVDDLASVGMDLWAQEQGYERIEPGLAGV